MTTASAFGALPPGLRDPLLAEYESLVQNYLERRWTPAGLSGGKFCEIVYTIVDGFGSGAYKSSPIKPRNMVQACLTLEQRANVPRSFQILIPRLLPSLYEVRNNRGVGHAGGDVDSNYMDATLVLSMANWIMAELVRVLHSLGSTTDAQAMVDSLVSRRTPLVWEQDGVRRVLNPALKMPDQVLLLVSSAPGKVAIADLLAWTGFSGERRNFMRVIQTLHKNRKIEVAGESITVLPPGAAQVENLVRKHLASQEKRTKK